MEFKNVGMTFTNYIVPSLKHLYLAVDFWKLYELFSNQLQIVEEKKIPNYHDSGIDVNKHEISDTERATLDIVVNCSPFALEGLWKNNSIHHEIDVGDAKLIKQRHFPVSPAVEKVHVS